MTKSFVSGNNTVSKICTGIFVLLTVAGTTFWAMQIFQTPSIPSARALNTNSQMLVNGQVGAAGHLFGNPSATVHHIRLRGIVAKSNRKQPTWQGYAIFESGEQTSRVVEIGEQLEHGLLLESLTPESAILIDQGKRIEFKLHTPAN